MQTEAERNLRKLLKKRERERERERETERSRKKFNLSRTMVDVAYSSHNMSHNHSKTKQVDNQEYLFTIVWITFVYRAFSSSFTRMIYMLSIFIPEAMTNVM